MRVPHPLSLHFSLAVPHSWFRGCPSHRPAHPLTTTQPVLVEPIDIYLLSFTSLPVISLPAVCASSRLLGYTCSTISSNSLSISSLRCFELEEKLFSTPVIPAFVRRENHKLKASLGFTEILPLKTKKDE